MKVTFVNPNLGYFGVPNLGLAYVMASVKDSHQTHLIDFTFRKNRKAGDLQKSLSSFRPDIVAFSVNSFTLRDSLRLARYIKTFSKNIQIFFGGIHPTLFPEETLSDPAVDVVCIGEGEEAFKQYLDCLQSERLSEVAGIWYKDASGSVVKNALRPFNVDLDQLAFPDWADWEIEPYLASRSLFIGSLPHLASRGCPYDCSFCSSPVLRKALPGKFFRLRSAANVVEEIGLHYDKYSQEGFKRVVFLDSVFGLDESWFREFSEIYAGRGLSRALPWICQTRADLISDEWCKNANRAGCLLVDLGIESGNEILRKEVFRKQVSNEQIFNAVSLLNRYRIPYRINMILGCPQETKATLNETLRFKNRINPVGVRYTLYQPLPKTEMGISFDLTRKGWIRGAINVWDLPQVSSRGLSKSYLFFATLKQRLLRYFRSLRGYRLLVKKSILGEFLGYLFSVGPNKRRIPLTHSYVLSSWFDKIEQLYLLSRIKRKQEIIG